MKYIILITIALLFVNNQYGQTIIDMSSEDIPSGFQKNGEYYLKDINGYMDYYEGTWQFIDGSSEFRIMIEKVEMEHIIVEDVIDYFSDGILINYQKYENGILVFESPENENVGGIIESFGNLSIGFTDYERNNAFFGLDLTLIPIGSNEYDLKFELDAHERSNTYHDEHPNEPFFSIPNDIIMTKM